ncbi:uncharacterized protein LOC144249027 isoform X4 [Urocitellus parryii]
MATRPAARGRPCALLPPSAAEPGPASLATAAASMVGARSLQRRAGAPGRVRSSGDVGTAGSAHSGEETARRIRCARCHGTSAAFFLGVSGDLRTMSVKLPTEVPARSDTQIHQLLLQDYQPPIPKTETYSSS